MFGSMKRQRILRQRAEAVPERSQAARALVSALREAEAAMVALKETNDKFYRSDQPVEQAVLSSLRRDRERTFAFLVAREVMAEAPHLARALDVRVSIGRAMPFVDWIEDVTDKDLAAVAGQRTPKGEPA